MCRSATVNDLAIPSQEDKHQFLGTITEGDKAKLWMITLTMNQRAVKFKIDTGADVTVISERKYQKEQDGPLQKSNAPLVGPGQTQLRVLGYFEAKIQWKKEMTKEKVYVVKILRIPLAGRPVIQKLKLVTLQIHNVTKNQEGVVQEFPDLFEGLGRIQGNYHIELRDEAIPYSVSVPRRVPIPLLPKVKTELERMEHLGVISKVNEPTDWCAGMVVVPKPNDRVRICVDLTKLNYYVKRERHILPSVDEVLAQVGDAKVFSKLDVNSGFWQIELDPESAKLTTFITPYGRYMFNRLPFGIT